MTDVVQTDLGHINLRGRVQDGRFVDGVEQALGQKLPVEPNRLTSGTHRVYWLGPDEWQIVTALGNAPDLLRRLVDGLGDRHAAINDVSGGQVAMHLHGAGVPDKLAMGCTLDLHPAAFGVGACAQSALAKANVLLGCIDDEPLYELMVRRSYSDYLLRWLRHAGLADDE